MGIDQIQSRRGTGSLGGFGLRGNSPESMHLDTGQGVHSSFPEHADDSSGVRGTGSLKAKASSTLTLDASRESDAFAHKFAEQHKKLLASMTDKERTEFLAVVAGIAGPGTGKAAKETEQSLIKLAKSGELLDKDSSGRTILDDLARRLHEPLNPVVAKALADHPKVHYVDSVLQGLVNKLANPNGSTHQGQHTFTCTTTDIEILMQRTSPADFTRFALGLAFDGTGVTPNGAKIPLDTSELNRDLAKHNHDDRGSLDAMIQGSLYSYAVKTYNADGSRKFGGGRGGLTGAYGGKGGGLTEGQVSGLFDSVFGIKSQVVTVTAANRDQVKAMLMQTLSSSWLQKSGSDGTAGIPIGITEPGGFGHEVILNKIKAGVAYFTDPRTGKGTSMPIDQLLNRLDAVLEPTYVPPKLQQQMQTSGVLPPDGNFRSTALWAQAYGGAASPARGL